MSQPESNNAFAWLPLIAGAGLWGTVGLFVPPLVAAGFSTIDIALLRMGGSFLIMLPLLLLISRGQLRLNRFTDIKYFIMTGLVSLGLFQWFYLTAIQQLGMSLAVVLLYTAPAMVVIMARFVFGEVITPVKIISLIIMLSGCVLALELPYGIEGRITLSGILFGAGAAFCFALYNITSKFALVRYDRWTVTFYTFVFATIGLLPFSGMMSVGTINLSVDVLFIIIGMILFTSILAYGLYISGLRRIESGKATVAAVTEVVVAVTLGMLFAGDRLSLMSAAGIFMVVTAVLLISLSGKKSESV